MKTNEDAVDEDAVDEDAVDEDAVDKDAVDKDELYSMIRGTRKWLGRNRLADGSVVPTPKHEPFSNPKRPKLYEPYVVRTKNLLLNKMDLCRTDKPLRRSGRDYDPSYHARIRSAKTVAAERLRHLQTVGTARQVTRALINMSEIFAPSDIVEIFKKVDPECPRLIHQFPVIKIGMKPLIATIAMLLHGTNMKLTQGENEQYEIVIGTHEQPEVIGRLFFMRDAKSRRPPSPRILNNKIERWITKITGVYKALYRVDTKPTSLQPNNWHGILQYYNVPLNNQLWQKNNNQDQVTCYDCFRELAQYLANVDRGASEKTRSQTGEIFLFAAEEKSDGDQVKSVDLIPLAYSLLYGPKKDLINQWIFRVLESHTSLECTLELQDLKHLKHKELVAELTKRPHLLAPLVRAIHSIQQPHSI